MVIFSPETYASDADPVLVGLQAEEQWTPLYWHRCSFSSAIFLQVMQNLIRNPNINSNHLFRADILSETSHPSDFRAVEDDVLAPWKTKIQGFDLQSVIVRRLIPRNAQLDPALVQTCLVFGSAKQQDPDGVADIEQKTLVLYIPHISSAADCPFYHPPVRGIAFLHTLNGQSAQEGTISIHYQLFADDVEGKRKEDGGEGEGGRGRGPVKGPTAPSTKLLRTAQHLLATIDKHGRGNQAGYRKRVRHDVVLPQARVQNRYAALKARYARGLIARWAEATDPSKHVFEDLGIAAFLIELWRDMYLAPGDDGDADADVDADAVDAAADADAADAAAAAVPTSGARHRRRRRRRHCRKPKFPGFVDIGCGNGLLVHVLRSEGFDGWGFDARARRSWRTYGETTRAHLRELVLVPCVAVAGDESRHRPPDGADAGKERHEEGGEEKEECATARTAPAVATHDGRFAPATFIVSNHADELTPWTPLLATLSRSPFLVIPCCSHALSGARFRAPPPPPPPKAAATSGPGPGPGPGSGSGARGSSAYASLVVWVAGLAEQCGWRVETEMLRIPSTRNTALLGRVRTKMTKTKKKKKKTEQQQEQEQQNRTTSGSSSSSSSSGGGGGDADDGAAPRDRAGGTASNTDEEDGDEDDRRRLVEEVLERNGGAGGWVENAMKLVKGAPRGH